MKITANISQHELDCKCGSSKCNVTIDKREPIIKMVQSVGDDLMTKWNGNKLSIVITSGARCYKHNRKIGSTDGSRHPRGSAIDFKVYIDDVRINSELVAKHCRDKWPEQFGVGEYRSFTHLDSRPWCARWVSE